MNIEIQRNGEFVDEFLNMKLINMYCKHVINNQKEKSNQLLVKSHEIGYEFCEWGSHNGHPSDLSYHLDIIKNMERDNYNHSIRIVICKYSFCNEPIIWVDNLHSSIRYIRKYGKETKLKDIPFYVVDLTNLDSPILKGYRNSLRLEYSNILGAMSSAYFRYEMSNSKELIDVGYTIEDLLIDNPSLYTYK